MVEIADGKTTKKTPRCKDPLPWGAVRLKFPRDVDRDEAEHFAWAVLKPDDWRKEREQRTARASRKMRCSCSR